MASADSSRAGVFRRELRRPGGCAACRSNHRSRVCGMLHGRSMPAAFRPWNASGFWLPTRTKREQ